MRRDIYTDEHEAFRDMVRSFIEKEIAPHHEQWEKDGIERYTTEIVAENLTMLDRPSTSGPGPVAGGTSERSTAGTPVAAGSEPTDPGTDGDDLPF